MTLVNRPLMCLPMIERSLPINMIIAINGRARTLLTAAA